MTKIRVYKPGSREPYVGKSLIGFRDGIEFGVRLKIHTDGQKILGQLNLYDSPNNHLPVFFSTIGESKTSVIKMVNNYLKNSSTPELRQVEFLFYQRDFIHS